MLKWFESHQLIVLGIMIVLGLTINGCLRAESRYQYIPNDEHTYPKVFDRKTGVVYSYTRGADDERCENDYVSAHRTYKKTKVSR